MKVEAVKNTILLFASCPCNISINSSLDNFINSSLLILGIAILLGYIT